MDKNEGVRYSDQGEEGRGEGGGEGEGDSEGGWRARCMMYSCAPFKYRPCKGQRTGRSQRGVERVFQTQ